MKKQIGFTLIELIVFIVIIGILGSTFFISFNNALNNTGSAQDNLKALQTATQCMEWFIGQRRLKGFSSLSCPSTSVPSFCTATGLTVNIACTTLSSDSNYKTITVTVSGAGDATLTTLIADY